MLSISQTSRGFFFVEWISTEKGPKIVNLENIKLDIDFSNRNDLKNIIESYKSNDKSDSKSLSLVLNSKEILISKIELLDSKHKNVSLIKWHESKILGKEFCENYYNYYFPLVAVDQIHYYLSVHLSRKVKDNILLAASELGFQLRYLSVDIFSASIGARYIYSNNINDKYLIWKICNNNKHKLVLYNKNNMIAYTEIYKKNNRFKSHKYIGPIKYESLLINCITAILINKSNYDRFDNIFIYQTKQNISEINKIVNLNFKNITIISFNKMIDKNMDNNFFKYMPFVENGITFKGLDV